MAGDKTPAEITSGNPSDTSLIHASQDGVSNDSRSHNERDISRLQSSIQEFVDTKAYEIGDLVIFETIQRRCINPVAASGGTVFAPVDWTASDSVGIKNVVTVYSQADFPAPISGLIHLVDDTAYLIGGNISLTIPLLMQPNNRNKIFSLLGYGEDPLINFTGDTLIVTSGVGEGTFSNVVNSGGKAQFEADSPHGMSSGQLVFVEGGPYNSVVRITATTTNDFLTNQDFISTATGDFSQGISSLELSGLTIENGTEVVDIFFSSNAIGNCIIRNIETINSQTLGIIQNATFVDLFNYFIVKPLSPIQFIDCRNVIIQNVFGSDEIDVSSVFQFFGSLTTFVSASNNVIDVGQGFMFSFPTSFANGVNTDLEFHVHDCKDLNTTHTTLFDTTGTGLTEKSSNAFVHDNGLQRDSISFIITRWDVSLSNEGTVTVDEAGKVGNGQPMDDGTNDWNVPRNERFTLTTPSSGLITYDGLRTIEVLVVYTATIRSGTEGDRIFIELEHNGSANNNTKIFATQGALSGGGAVTSFRYTISGSFIFPVDPSGPSTFRMLAGNQTAQNNLEVEHAVLTISEIE